VDNSPKPRVLYDENLARLYALRDQLDIEEVIYLSTLEEVDAGDCDDCGAYTSRVSYFSVVVCEPCALARHRLRVRMARDHRQAMLPPRGERDNSYQQ
jgi:hypothetical protein